MDAAYYLVHSLSSGAEFEERDRAAARNFVNAGGKLKHVIYLGGLQPREGSLESMSPHLRSRGEVGRYLRSNLPTTEFRAGPIIGSGSVSFEMVRYLTERLPIMVTPRWINNLIQPVAIRDVLDYLVSALEIEPAGIVEIGGDRISFREMMGIFAEARGLKRAILSTPVLAPHLASLWIGAVTPIPSSYAVPLVEGIVHPLVADTRKARRLFPEVRPTSYRIAVELAIERVKTGGVETRWTGSLGTGKEEYLVLDEEGFFREIRSVWLPASPEKVYEKFGSLGGDRGWLVWNWAWRFRGLLDRMIGGPGLRRGRRHPTEAFAGETIDFWRVEIAEPPRLLRLRAEMRLPGRAWLQWEARPENRGTRLVQTAFFAPKGLFGFLYWYGLYPFHRRIFSDLIQALVAEEGERLLRRKAG
jgi:uncharacterized protein YbjT (DUF2867 family)